MKSNIDANGAIKNKLKERSFFLMAAGLALVVALLGTQLYQYYLQVTYPKSFLYGTWIEQNVAGYATDRFVLNENGVVINGRVVDTNFAFDGQFFEYRFGDDTKRFQILNQEFSEMKLISQPHYQPIYRLDAKYQHNIR
ncbi:DUF2850 domain-containing protein [Vibrio scophthalmi]|uniref:DUF2850 domain-containing protein n=1 Tax=Vibrio scophthalmi TaxID=45658 RepID=UPI002FEEB608